MKVLILGHARHGKDTVAELLHKHAGLHFVSSSEAAGRAAVWPVLGPRYGYATFQDCFDDRAAHRQEWFELISAYNTPDKARLTREILATNDAYVGLRAADEFDAAHALFDFIIWVDASARLPPEGAASCTLTLAHVKAKAWLRLLVLTNNGDVADLEERVRANIVPLLVEK